MTTKCAHLGILKFPTETPPNKQALKININHAKFLKKKTIITTRNLRIRTQLKTMKTVNHSK